MERLNKPIITSKTIKDIEDIEDMSFFTHAKIFDDLLIIAQKETNCFVLKTTEGLIIIDAIWPAQAAFEAIINAIKDIGWNPDRIKKLLLTHGHVDHTGCGKWFVDRYHVDTYLSETDDLFWTKYPTKPDRPETWKDYEINVYVKDGDVITLGDKTIYVYETPGHTPGCLSYIFPVKDDGVNHMAALWGGTTPPYTKQGIIQYLKSLNYFINAAKYKNVDVALSNHTSVDNGLERIEYSRKRMSYMPNIYVIGQTGFIKYCEVFRTLSYDNLNKLK